MAHASTPHAGSRYGHARKGGTTPLPTLAQLKTASITRENKGDGTAGLAGTVDEVMSDIKKANDRHQEGN